MKQITVGTYEIGYGYAELVLIEGTGGEFYLMPGDIKHPRIKIGAECDRWWKIVEVVLHEAVELAAANIRVRYYPQDDVGRDQHAYVFVLTHSQFSECIAHGADYLCNCWDDLKREWERWNQPAEEVTTA